MKTWKLALLVSVVAAGAVFGVAAVALGGVPGQGSLFGGHGPGMMFAADGDRPSGGGGLGCGGSALMQDPQARDDMLKLREEHRSEMQAWWKAYGDDPRSEAAQKALDELRSEHRADMLDLFEKYGVTPPEGFGEDGGCGPGMGQGGGCGGRGAGLLGDGGSGCGGAGMMGGGQGWDGGQSWDGATL